MANIETTGLTEKQLLWISYYVGEAKLNAQKAARLAGYSDAYDAGWINKCNPDIINYVKILLRERGMTAEETIVNLTDIASGDMDDFITVDDEEFGLWHFDYVKAKKAGKTHLIQSIKRGKGTVEFKLYSKLDALDTMAHIHKLVNKENRELQISQLTVILNAFPEEVRQKVKERLLLEE